MRMSQQIRISGIAAAASLLTLSVFFSVPAVAGSIPLAWDPVSDPDLAGYRVYYGTSPNFYSNNKDAGNVTEYTLTGLDDCTYYHVAVKAYDSSGYESDEYSNEVSGLPTPIVSELSPASGEQGQSLTVTVTGWSFDSGAAVTFSDPKVTVSSTTYVSCTRLDVAISIASDAALGWNTVEVVNSDGTHGSRAQAFEVRAISPPSVNGTNPSDGASEIPVTVRPTVTFSEEMDPASITTGTVRLLGPGDAPISQASGSPSLDGAGLVATIVPTDDLDLDTVYRIQVIGGSGGVLDLQGTAMESNYQHGQGFRTVSAPDPTPPDVAATVPMAGERSVKVDVRPTVTFNEVMDAGSISASTVRLMGPNESPVAQAAGSPSLSASGLVATITPAAPLSESTFYRIEVIGGASGVKDAQGEAMASTYSQNPPFLTWGKGQPPDKVNNLRRKDRK
jgi:hypothetical protein